jgi:uncharacterized protein (DUF1684 family)
MRRLVLLASLAGLLAGCARNTWPDPPVIDRAKYEAEHASWRKEQQSLVGEVLPIVGIWPLQEGDTPFGADESLPIVLPPSAGAARLGIFRRSGATVTVVPATGARLRLPDGTSVTQPMEVDGDLRIGSLVLSISEAGDDRRWITARDESHPAIVNPPAIEVYPLDARWRVAARLDAFEAPKPVRVPDVRGGSMSFLALGQLVFRLNDREQRLTAFGEPGGGQFFVMFKDPTNLTTTYSGYRIITPEVVGDGQWTIVDFNFALNPPCAYSRFTLCPLPPAENQLPVSVEAGLKRLPSVRGYSPS